MTRKEVEEEEREENEKSREIGKFKRWNASRVETGEEKKHRKREHFSTNIHIFISTRFRLRLLKN